MHLAGCSIQLPRITAAISKISLATEKGVYLSVWSITHRTMQMGNWRYSTMLLQPSALYEVSASPLLRPLNCVSTAPTSEVFSTITLELLTSEESRWVSLPWLNDREQQSATEKYKRYTNTVPTVFAALYTSQIYLFPNVTEQHSPCSGEHKEIHW